MTPHQFEASIINWAQGQPDIQALIQIGSRVQIGGHVDVWSDWDYHLVSSSPGRYHQVGWLADIAPFWCAHVERSIHGSIKVSAVFENGLEADFIPLAAWQMKLVYWAMRYPAWGKWMPARLHEGIVKIRVVLLGSGSRVLIGGRLWEKRLEALNASWPTLRMSAEDFDRHVSAFWQKSVWVAKKIARPEPRSALHWLHKLIIEHSYALLEEEAWLAGKVARPGALKAEKWLDARRLKQTDINTNLNQKVLAQVLVAELALFEEVSGSVSRSRGFHLADHSAVANWLRIELAKLAG